jgi:tetratricopeptide (TPR) repeat protein
MTFFGSLSGSPMAMVFVMVSLLNVFYGLRVARSMGQGWTALNREPLRREQKQLIDRAAFFLGIPLGVIIHELGHALTVWLFGGEVVDVGYGFYWGYVAHTGFYTPTQLWIIAMAGTIGSLLYGVVMYLIFSRLRLSTYRYFALRILRVHLYYSLVFYPIFTLVSFVGDWRTIYDFGATPLLSGVTLAIHLSILGLFYYSDRQGLFDMPGFDTVDDQAQFELLKAQAAEHPHDAQLQLRLVDAYRQSGATHIGTRHLKNYLKENPNSADGYLQLALLQAQGKREIPSKAKNSAAKALSLGLSNPVAIVQANRIVGEYSLNVGKLDEALDRFNQGIAAAKAAGHPELSAHLHYSRAVVYRRQGKYDFALQDIQEAIRLARGTGQGQLVSRYENELATIQSHSGRSPRTPPYQ